MTQDTIFAVATAPGRGAIAVLRLSGPAVAPTLKALGAGGLTPAFAAPAPAFASGPATCSRGGWLLAAVPFGLRRVLGISGAYATRMLANVRAGRLPAQIVGCSGALSLAAAFKQEGFPVDKHFGPQSGL